MTKEQRERWDYWFRNHQSRLVTNTEDTKVLEFQAPGTIEYSITFIFYEKAGTLAITGDLGNLIAKNDNMTLAGFRSFVHDPDYFHEKIRCMDRPVYWYEESRFQKELLDAIREEQKMPQFVNALEERYSYAKDESLTSGVLEEFWREILKDFSETYGVDTTNLDAFHECVPNAYYLDPETMGRYNTGILDLYLYAYQLAIKRLER